MTKLSVKQMVSIFVAVDAKLKEYQEGMKDSISYKDDYRKYYEELMSARDTLKEIFLEV